MAGINISGKHRVTSKIASQLASFLFEEEFGELENFSSEEISVLQKAKAILMKHC